MSAKIVDQDGRESAYQDDIRSDYHVCLLRMSTMCVGHDDTRSVYHVCRPCVNSKGTDGIGFLMRYMFSRELVKPVMARVYGIFFLSVES